MSPNTPPNPTPTPAQTPAPSQGQNDKLLAGLAYIIFFIPLLTQNRTAFVNYHANQGLLLFICYVAVHILLSFVVMPMMFFGPLLFILYPLFSLAALALCIIGIMNVVKGEMKPLPLIGGFTIIK